VHAAARSTTGDLLAAAGADGSVRIWDLRLHPRRAVATLRADRRAGQEARILAVAFSPDARVLAAIHLDGALRLWDLPSGAELPARLKHDAASCLAFSPSGRTLATGGMDSTLKLWEVEGARAGEARRELHRQPLSVTAVTYAGGILATGHAQGLIRVNDAQSLRLMATVRGPRALVSLLASSPEGRRLVIGGQDRTLRLVDLGSGGTLWTAAPHRRPTVAVAFLPCGSALATASLEHAVHVLDVTSGIALGSLWCRPEEAVVGISASPGGSLAATLGDGRVRVWSPAHSLPQS
jgi:WD40 repeat protein